ncbi:class I SAM-dependent methyltransferase [Usitatibacter palustris]|uniref:2-methoxy-6-polyprenyl-1,4-benzoquinol methylase, mitochondrial n=1 Tax=Usitatibacter palustris TaxID=2732487 RepID=A0A6M4H4D0_9PROT|nr:class I SAM-dependent methyltransferase [Usitatibacter palustris]QJR13573.1 2-methoxy-6-polyprenyl-1,4-benzoquinol methylase, mitochondrial [Usitatibacter palustris]
MTRDANLGQRPDNWAHGNTYERYVGRWSRKVAPEFLAWLNMPPNRRWVDVGCGTGALCAAILDRCSPASVTGVEPSEGFLKTAKENLAGRATFHVGSATALPLGNASADVVVSGLVLNFVPDQPAAVREMARVADKGATIAAYVWDYAGKMDLMTYFWNAAVALDPKVVNLVESLRFPVCRPEGLESLFTGAGLKGVEVSAVDIPTNFADFEDYWQPFLGGQGPAPSYAMSLDEASRSRLRDRLRESVPIAYDGSIPMTARAWAVRAVVLG